MADPSIYKLKASLDLFSLKPPAHKLINEKKHTKKVLYNSNSFKRPSISQIVN